MEAALIAERRAAILFSEALGKKEALGEVPGPDSVTFCMLEGCDVPVTNAASSACCDQHLMLHSVISSTEVPSVPVSDAVTLCVLEGCENPVPNVSEQACCASHLKLHGYMMLQASDSANSDAQSRPNAPLGTVSVRVRSGGKTPVTPGPLKQPEPHAGAGKQKRQGNELASKGLGRDARPELHEGGKRPGAAAGSPDPVKRARKSLNFAGDGTLCTGCGSIAPLDSELCDSCAGLRRAQAAVGRGYTVTPGGPGTAGVATAGAAAPNLAQLHQLVQAPTLASGGLHHILRFVKAYRKYSGELTLLRSQGYSVRPRSMKACMEPRVLQTLCRYELGLEGNDA